MVYFRKYLDYKNRLRRDRWIFCLQKRIPKNLKIPESFFPNAEQYRASCIAQNFPFRSPFMQYILSNVTSANIQEKLNKTCKIFFVKMPINIVNRIHYNGKIWKYSRYNQCISSADNRFMFENIWLTNSMRIDRACREFNEFIPRIYRCDILFLDISHGKLTIDQLEFLTSAVINCNLYSTTITYNDGLESSMEDIIQVLSNAERIFGLSGSLCSFCNNYSLFVARCSTIKFIELRYSSETFDVSEFYKCLKLTRSLTEFVITSNFDTIVVDNVMDEILETTSFLFVPPAIGYFGVDELKCERIYEIQKNELLKR